MTTSAVSLTSAVTEKTTTADTKETINTDGISVTEGLPKTDKILIGVFIPVAIILIFIFLYFIKVTFFNTSKVSVENTSENNIQIIHEK